MNNGGDQDFLLLDSVDNPTTVGDQLSSILVVELRNFSPRPRELRQHSGLLDDVLHDRTSVSRRVVGDIGGYGFQILVSAPTRLLGEPLAKPGFYLLLRQRAV